MLYIKICGLFIFVLAFQNCSNFEATSPGGSNTVASQSSEEPVLNPLPGISDVFVPAEEGETSADGGLTNAFVQQGLVSQADLTAISNLRGAMGVNPDLPNPELNVCSNYQPMMFPHSKSRDPCSGFYESKNNNAKNLEKEIYVFGMYNATSASHGFNKSRQIVEMPIFIPKGSKPIELYLNSYEPTAWLLHGDVQRVKEIRTFGLYCQMVKGAAPSAKLYLSSAEQGINELHKFIDELNLEKDIEFSSILLRIYVGSDLSRFVTSYNRQCLGEFVAAP